MFTLTHRCTDGWNHTSPLILYAEAYKCRAEMRLDINYCRLSFLITTFNAPSTLTNAFIPK